MSPIKRNDLSNSFNSHIRHCLLYAIESFKAGANVFSQGFKPLYHYLNESFNSNRVVQFLSILKDDFLPFLN